MFLSARSSRKQSSEHKGNSPHLLQCLFVSLNCTQSTLLVFHSSQIHSGDLLDSSLFCLIQLAKGQQDKWRILLASSGSGWETECCNSGRGSFLTSRVTPVAAITRIRGQSQSSLQTQAHSSWCSKGTSVMDFCRPRTPLRCFSSRTCREGGWVNVRLQIFWLNYCVFRDDASFTHSGGPGWT